MTEDTNVIEMPIAEVDPVKQAIEVVAKAREENTAKAKAGWEEIVAVCEKYNATLSAQAYVLVGTTKLPVAMNFGGLSLSTEIHFSVNG